MFTRNLQVYLDSMYGTLFKVLDVDLAYPQRYKLECQFCKEVHIVDFWGFGERGKPPPTAENAGSQPTRRFLLHQCRNPQIGTQDRKVLKQHRQKIFLLQQYWHRAWITYVLEVYIYFLEYMTADVEIHRKWLPRGYMEVNARPNDPDQRRMNLRPDWEEAEIGLQEHLDTQFGNILIWEDFQMFFAAHEGEVPRYALPLPAFLEETGESGVTDHCRRQCEDLCLIDDDQPQPPPESWVRATWPPPYPNSDRSESISFFRLSNAQGCYRSGKDPRSAAQLHTPESTPEAEEEEEAVPMAEDDDEPLPAEPPVGETRNPSV
jgi:hypothetical protein